MLFRSSLRMDDASLCRFMAPVPEPEWVAQSRTFSVKECLSHSNDTKPPLSWTLQIVYIPPPPFNIVPSLHSTAFLPLPSISSSLHSKLTHISLHQHGHPLEELPLIAFCTLVFSFHLIARSLVSFSARILFFAFLSSSSILLGPSSQTVIILSNRTLPHQQRSVISLSKLSTPRHIHSYDQQLSFRLERRPSNTFASTSWTRLVTTLSAFWAASRPRRNLMTLLPCLNLIRCPHLACRCLVCRSPSTGRGVARSALLLPHRASV